MKPLLKLLKQDECIGKILENISLEEYTIIVTADHGNRGSNA